jgi:hypothetical protein
MVRTICRRSHGSRGIHGKTMSRPQPLMNPADWKNGDIKKVTTA